MARINNYTILTILVACAHFGLNPNTDLTIFVIAFGLAGINQALWTIIHFANRVGSDREIKKLDKSDSDNSFWSTFMT